MTLVDAVEADGYRPEYALLVLMDPAVEWGHEDPDVPRFRDRGDRPTGTFAGTGAGWVTAQAPGLDDHVVRVELHDGPPPADHEEYDDVLEAPYRSSSGGLSVTTLTGGVGPADLDLGDAEWFRVRVARRQADTESTSGYSWVLRFWADPVVEPPVWLARSQSAIGGPDNGWHSALPRWVTEVAGIATGMARRLGRPVTPQQVEDGFHSPPLYPLGWLDEPLWPRRSATDHVSPGYRARDAQERRRLDETAEELGVPPVRRKRDVFPLLVAAGILAREGTDAYRVGQPARIDTVLSLPPDQVEAVRQRDMRSRYGAVAEDLEAVLRWTPRTPLETTPAELAERLLVTEAELGEALAYAEETGLLHNEGGGPLRLWLGPRGIS
ncbi:hypothetical protein [Micromonospora tarensis]|uniref:Uncharacterized protein n=1 Tax=Micromonospora tarensis TaxID=2806100 RepID=A0ABS1YFF8_9ACTN|nr:hypothetical protein [Micromonospora tarensis]MBM0276058.1 hypothetical protein [Micromonospora tarensis]